MHECWESLGPETLGSIREAEGIPQDATTASVSLDGVMVPLRPGEDGRAKASWREAACGTVSFHDAEGKRLKTLYLGPMPESGKLTLKAQLASEVAHIRRARPEIGIVAIADGAADNWTFLETLSPETEVIDFWHACEHLQTASDHAVAPGWFEKYREILRHDPRGVAKVIRALRHLRDAAAAPDRAETERELAFFRKHRHRMRYHALKEEGIAIGSGVVEAANKTLVTQRMKRSGMRWRIVGGQAVLTFRALIKSGRFERAWKALISATDTPANDNISPRADYLPAVLMPNPSDDQYCRARAANDKGVPWRRFEDTPLVEVPSAELLVVLPERGGRYLEIVARGDFNGDGWDDVVVGHSGAPSEVSPDKHDLMAMTRTQPDAVLRAIEPLDLC